MLILERKKVANRLILISMAEQERRVVVIRANGESEVARLISEASTTVGTGILELRRIEAARGIVATLSRSSNVMYIPWQNQMLLEMPGGGWGQPWGHTHVLHANHLQHPSLGITSGNSSPPSASATNARFRTK